MEAQEEVKGTRSMIKKSIIKSAAAVVFALILACSVMLTTLAVSYDHVAEELSSMGLVHGRGDGDFALNDPLTRAEALVLIIRLLGLEREALENEYEHPFTDAAGWAEKYIAYSYETGLVNGMTATTFEPDTLCTTQMYVALMLRALGYRIFVTDEAESDFHYNQTITFGRNIGIVDDFLLEGRFLRGNVIAITYLALKTETRGGAYPSLLSKLVADGVITANSAAPALEKFKLYDEFSRISSSLKGTGNIEMSMFMDMIDPALPGNIQSALMLTMTDGNSGVRFKAYMEMEVNVSDEKIISRMWLYIVDGMLYIDDEEVKIKMPAENADFNINALIAMTDIGESTANPLYTIKSITRNSSYGLDEYLVTFAGGYVNSILGTAAGTAAGSSAKPATAAYYAENGELKWISMYFEIGDASTDLDIVIVAAGNDVVLTLPADLHEYILYDQGLFG